jgi:hypothetical protein
MLVGLTHNILFPGNEYPGGHLTYARVTSKIDYLNVCDWFPPLNSLWALGGAGKSPKNCLSPALITC